MPATIFTAGGASDSLALAGGNDGALVIQTGPSGAKVNALSFASDGTPTFLKARGGVAQIQTFQTGAAATGTTVLPFDDTIPQITEGNEFMSLAITPTNAASLLEIDVTIWLLNSIANHITAALFQDSTANAIAVQDVTNSANWSCCITFKHIMTAGTTSATTFRVRGGAASGTTSFNSTDGGVRKFGGAISSRITIKEYLP